MQRTCMGAAMTAGPPRRTARPPKRAPEARVKSGEAMLDESKFLPSWNVPSLFSDGAAESTSR